MTFVRRIAAYFVVLVGVVSPSSTQAGYDSGQAMSGPATNALVRAYEISGLDGSAPAPFSLQPYVVSIQAGDSYFVVSFASQTSRQRRDVVVRGEAATVLATEQLTKQLDQLPPTTEEVLLPGIVAGEIIAVYRRAVSDGSISRVATSGAYDLGFRAFAGGAGVGFTARDAPQGSTSLKPEPTPTPKPGSLRCLSPCSGMGYIISVLNHRVVIRRMVTL